MTAEDVPALLDVQEGGATAGLSHIFPQDLYPFSRDVIGARWRAEVADAAIGTFVSTDDAGQLNGFVATNGNELLHFGTAVETWGSGLARELHDAALAVMRRSVPDATRFTLHVFEENHRARRFYEKLGWSPTGAARRSSFPPQPVLVEYACDVAHHNVATQYVDDANLRARQRLWAAQQPRFDSVGWLLDLVRVSGADADRRVLDVGCGNGAYLRAMRARGVVAVGTDLSRGMLEAAAHTPVVQGDAQHLPFADGVFDVVLAPYMLYHLDDPVRGARELRRVLRGGGTCAVTTNGSAHLRALRAIVEDVVRAATPGWEMRDPSTRWFTLDNGADVLRQAFDTVTTVRPRDVKPVRLRDASIAADYVASVADFYGPEVNGEWADVVAAVRTRVAAIIEAEGEFVVAADTGAFVCR